jgi:hypothetical protein
MAWWWTVTWDLRPGYMLDSSDAKANAIALGDSGDSVERVAAAAFIIQLPEERATSPAISARLPRPPSSSSRRTTALPRTAMSAKKT